MPEVVCRCDGDQRAEEVGVDLLHGRAPAVEVQRDEADAEVECFARDFVPVDEGAPVSVDGD